MAEIRIIDSNCCKELYVILNKLNLFYKLPNELKQYIQENQNKLYKFDFNLNLPLIYQLENENTRKYISYIYLKYINNSIEEKNLLLNKYEENEDKYQTNLREKYNPDDLLKNKKNDIQEYKNNITEETAIVEYKEKNFLQKIFDKIKHLFKKN